jgi:hypothetical protein
MGDMYLGRRMGFPKSRRVVQLDANRDLQLRGHFWKHPSYVPIRDSCPDIQQIRAAGVRGWGVPELVDRYNYCS